MLDVKAVLDACLNELSKEYEIEEVDNIPQLELHRSGIWKIQIPALVLGKAEDVEAYILFPNDFPYSMPYVIILDDRFKYLPHISLKSRNLCLYEDGVVYDAENIEGLIRDNIDRTKKWIEYYYSRDNSDEYAKEIRNYWSEQYDGEPKINDCWVLLGDIPVNTCEMIGVTYIKKNLRNGNTYRMNIVASDKERPIIRVIKSHHKTSDIHVLYIASLKTPNVPPFSMMGQDIIDRISGDDDKKIFRKYLNRFGNLNVLFPIGLNYALGGVHISDLKVNRNGYRNGTLTPFKVLTAFENKNKKLKRLHISVYSGLRIAERTAGELMKERFFLVAGLGSIGSNLCYYLNGYNNAVFTLTDGDYLSVDNIGRHLLGFEYISQYKSYAVAHYLLQYRPDRKVQALQKDLQQLKEEEINKASAIFVCTGDVMSEKWLIEKMNEGSIKKPAFILWLEPYGISGIMIYINPEDKESTERLREKANSCFIEFCLIEKDEYDGEKLTKRDAGCNGSYSLYSANDVTLFLSSIFPIIDRLIEQPSKSKCYRWVGNTNLAKEKGINLVTSEELSKNTLQELTI